jgi:hypothetical protein
MTKEEIRRLILTIYYAGLFKDHSATITLPAAQHQYTNHFRRSPDRNHFGGESRFSPIWRCDYRRHRPHSVTHELARLHTWSAVWRRVTDAVVQLANNIPPGPTHWNGPETVARLLRGFILDNRFYQE